MNLAIIIIIIVAFLFMLRNERVYNFRKYLIRMISEGAKRDINHGYDFNWRYDEFDSVSYYEMVYKFWKKLKVKNFWKNDSFVK